MLPARRAPANAKELLARVLGSRPVVPELLVDHGRRHALGLGPRPVRLPLRVDVLAAQPLLPLLRAQALDELLDLARQGYVVDRLGLAVAGPSRVRVAALAAVVFAVCHLSLPGLFAPTLAAGLAWSLAYLAGARVASLALSHALLGACWFAVVLERDPFRDLAALR